MPSASLASRTYRPPVTRVNLSPFISHVQLAAAVANEPRTGWAQLLRTGKFYDPRYGDFAVTKADLATMAANFATKYPKDPTRLAIDYNHGTSRPSSAAEGIAAGWIKTVELRAEGDELWGEVEWTEQAASLIDSKEYQFVSATFSFDYTNSNGGEEIGPTLLAAAVTNRPVVHGMQPLALALAEQGAVKLGEAQLSAVDDEAAEALFSFDEQRRRVQAAIGAVYGTRYSYGPDCYSGGVYLEALYDGFAVYCTSDGAKYRVDYAITADGTVTFTSDPVEVRVDYEPLTASIAEEQNMSTIKTKDAKGNEIELSQETVLELAKAHAPKPAVEPVELAALKSTVETQGATILSLQQSNAAMELSIRTRNAEAEFDALFRAGKVDAKQKDTLIKLALANNEMFKELTATLPVIREVSTVTGSDSAVAGSENKAALDLAITAELTLNPKLTKEQAYAAALDKNPKLYEG